MSESVLRSRLMIMRELLALTKEMDARAADEDFLIGGVQKRQNLIEEYDSVREDGAIPPIEPGERAEIKKIAGEIVEMDARISEALQKHKAQAKSDLTQSNNQQKVLGYVNQALSSSGSYMDYKK